MLVNTEIEMYVGEHGRSYQYRKNSTGTVGTVLERFFSSSTNLVLTRYGFSVPVQDLVLSRYGFSVPVQDLERFSVPVLFFGTGTVGTVFF